MPVEVAECYRVATPEGRLWLEKALLTVYLTLDEFSEQLSDLLDAISDKAQAAGWNDELNETLLRGDFDGQAPLRSPH